MAELDANSVSTQRSDSPAPTRSPRLRRPPTDRQRAAFYARRKAGALSKVPPGAPKLSAPPKLTGGFSGKTTR